MKRNWLDVLALLLIIIGGINSGSCRIFQI